MPAVPGYRLAAGAEGHRRLFPKFRSWIALGAPLELLSPLSVLRVVYPVCAILWCTQVSWLQWPDERRGWMYAAVGVAVAVWLALLFVRRIGVFFCHVLATLGIALVATLVWAGHGAEPALTFSPFYLPFVVFVALFLAPRGAFVQLLFAVTVFWLALSPAVGMGHAALITTTGGVAAAAAVVAVILLATSTTRSGAIDPETGLPNALGLAQRVAAGNDRTPLLVATLLLAGIDEAREALGYEEGTELLRRAVVDLQAVLPPGTVMARVEGDELVVVRELDPPAPAPARRAAAANQVGLPMNGTRGDWILSAGSPATGEPPGGTPERPAVPAPVHAAGLAMGQVLVDAVSTGGYLVGRTEVSLRPHVGLVFSPWEGSELPDLVRRSSLAARQASASGSVQVVSERLQGTLTAEDLTLLADLRLAAARGELHLAFQPQVEVRNGRTVAAEALLRWRSQRYGNVPPGRFIELAERTGYIDRLTDWVLAEALDVQVRFRRAGLVVPVSVNFSGRTLRRPNLARWILKELKARGLPPSALGVEVTETAATELYTAVPQLGPLRDRGVRVSIDDFGTGHTSMALLPHLPLDELKVDMSFVLRSGESYADAAIVRSVLDLAHRLGLDGVAEGVENEDIRRRMSEIGYDRLQGNYLSGPLPEEQFLAFALRPGATVASAAR